MSRTSKSATVSICDEMTRALENISKYVEELRGNQSLIEETIESYDNAKCRMDLIDCICDTLHKEA